MGDFTRKQVHIPYRGWFYVDGFKNDAEHEAAVAKYKAANERRRDEERKSREDPIYTDLMRDVSRGRFSADERKVIEARIKAFVTVDHYGKKEMQYITSMVEVRSELAKAIKDSHGGRVKELLATGVDLLCQDMHGQTMLHVAAQVGYGSVFDLLVENNPAALFVQDEKGRTPLQIWGWKCFGKGTFARCVERELAMLPARDKNANTFLHLLDEEGTTLLHGAAATGHKEAAGFIVEKNPAAPFIQDGHGNTPLHWAARGGHKDMVVFLYGKNPAALRVRDDDGNTPLHWAVRNGHKELVEFLVEKNPAALLVRDKDGNAPLHWAVRNGHKELAEFLVEKNPAALMAQDKDGNTPVHWAMMEFARKLSEQWPWWQSGRPPSKQEKMEMLSLVVKKDSHALSVQNKEGNTPLHLASLHGFRDDRASVKLLLKAGADPCVRNHEQKLPSKTCSEFDKNTVDILRKAERIKEAEKTARVSEEQPVKPKGKRAKKSASGPSPKMEIS